MSEEKEMQEPIEYDSDDLSSFVDLTDLESLEDIDSSDLFGDLGDIKDLGDISDVDNAMEATEADLEVLGPTNKVTLYNLIQGFDKSRLNEFTEIEQIKLASFVLNYHKREMEHVNEQEALELVNEWKTGKEE